MYSYLFNLSRGLYIYEHFFLQRKKKERAIDLHQFVPRGLKTCTRRVLGGNKKIYPTSRNRLRHKRADRPLLTRSLLMHTCAGIYRCID